MFTFSSEQNVLNWLLGNSDVSDWTIAFYDGDGLDGVAAVVLVLLEVDDDEPGVAVPDSGAQRLSPCPLNDEWDQIFGSFLSSQIDGD